MLGLPGVSYLDPDYYALGMLSTLFGGGMSSRLFQEIREKRGLVYSIYSFASAFQRRRALRRLCRHRREGGGGDPAAADRGAAPAAGDG